MVPDQLGVKVGLGIKAPPLDCHLLLSTCRLRGSIHPDIWNRQEEDQNIHFQPIYKC